MKLSDILKSGALGIGTAALARNPEALRGFGLVGNLAYNELNKQQEEEEKRKAEKEAAAQQPAQGMKRGGKVKKMKSGGYVKSADGCAQRGKTKGRMV